MNFISFVCSCFKSELWFRCVGLEAIIIPIKETSPWKNRCFWNGVERILQEQRFFWKKWSHVERQFFFRVLFLKLIHIYVLSNRVFYKATPKGRSQKKSYVCYKTLIGWDSQLSFLVTLVCFWKGLAGVNIGIPSCLSY